MLRRIRVHLLTLLLLIVNIWVAGMLSLLLFVYTWGKHSEFSDMISPLEGWDWVYIAILALHSWPALIWFSVTYSLVLRWALVYCNLRRVRVITPIIVFAIVASVLFSTVQEVMVDDRMTIDAMVLSSLLIATLLSTAITLLYPSLAPAMENCSLFARLCISLLVVIAIGYALGLTLNHLPLPRAVNLIVWSIGIAVLTTLVGRHYGLPESEIVWIVFGALGFRLLPSALGSLGTGLTELLRYLFSSQQDFALWHREEMGRSFGVAGQYFVGLIAGLATTAIAKRIATDR